MPARGGPDAPKGGYPEGRVSDLLHEIARVDAFVLRESTEFRWAPLTAFFVIASAWWVKGLAFVAVGALRDVRARRPVPITALSAVVALGLASISAAILKDAFDRARPAVADPTLQPLVATPGSSSFPSGHAATAFAAAAAVGVLCPRLRWPLYLLAALIALSRVYLGVHYWLDIAAGAVLGIVIGLGAAWLLRRDARPAGDAPVTNPGTSGTNTP